MTNTDDRMPAAYPRRANEEIGQRLAGARGGSLSG